MQKVERQSGFGLIEALVGIAIVSIVVGLTMQLLNGSFTNQVELRRALLIKKSFSGAEMVLISQRQCRCNFAPPGGAYSFRWDTASYKNQVIHLKQIRTYEDADNCTNPNPAKYGAPEILADTTGTSPSSPADYIKLVGITSVIPKLLYRGVMYIKPHGGAPVSFPIMLETRPDPSNPSYVFVDMCGVDRAS